MSRNAAEWPDGATNTAREIVFSTPPPLHLISWEIVTEVAAAGEVALSVPWPKGFGVVEGWTR